MLGAFGPDSSGDNQLTGTVMLSDVQETLRIQSVGCTTDGSTVEIHHDTTTFHIGRSFRERTKNGLGSVSEQPIHVKVRGFSDGLHQSFNLMVASRCESE